MNIKNVMMMAAMMPAFALAETNSNCAPASVEANDTTIRVNDQNIVIKQDGEQTSVKIYKMNGNEMTKISETQFVDGQEVEKVFVTSPFIPQTLSKRKRSLESHYPTFFFGCSQLPGSRVSMGGNNEMHSRDSKSWEWGITLTSLCFRLSNEMALTSSLSIGQVHHHFKDNYVLSTENGISTMTPIEGETLKKSYISYNVLRLPIMLEWQKRIGCHDAFLALGPSVEYRWHEHSRYFIGKHKHTETGDINLNPIGLNLEVRAGYSGVMLYARAGVTPLLNKTKAPECYPMTIGLGFRL